MSLLCSTYLDMADQQTWQSQSDFTSSRSLQNCRTFCFYIPIFQPATKSPFQIFMAHRPPKHGVVSFEDLLPVETEPYAASSIPDSHGLPWIPMNCHTSRNALVRRARMTWAKCGSCRATLGVQIFLSTPETNMSNGFAPSRRALVLTQTSLCSKKTGTLLSPVRLSV